jgi:signal transduction histidine kinase/CheY-like chemotaxis protein
MNKTNKRVLLTKILLSLGIIALIEITGFAILNYVGHKQEGLGVLINLSGRQRMLSQRITLLVHEFNNLDVLKSDIETSAKINTELNEKLNLFLESHNKLFTEAKERAKPGEELFVHYSNTGGLNDLVIKFEEEVKGFLTGKYKQSHLATFSQFTKFGFLANLDRAVKLFEEKNKELNNLFYKAELALLIANLFALFIIYIFLLRPMATIVVEREQELEVARDLALEESRFKSMFLANMSHELRTPLNGVLGTTDLIKSTRLNPEQKEYIDIISQSGKILLGVVNNILDLTKLEVGAVELDEIPFEPEKLLKSMPKSFQYPLLSKGIDLNVTCTRLPRVLWGDTVRITQILNNIISNAIKFTDEGSINLDAFYENEILSLTISDTGIGMTKEQLNRVFESFKQADSSTTRKYGGTGLGLSIVKEILGLMQAKYEVQSEVGKGTTFKFDIPLKMGTPKDLEPYKSQEFTLDSTFKRRLQDQGHNHEISSTPASDEAFKVLIVDDNEINRKLLVKILDRMKIHSITADSGNRAIELLEQERVDLVFMDYHMPELNGIETTKIIFEKIKNPPPIIALTADILPETAQECKKVGMKELLAKPIQRAELKRVLHAYLDLEELPSDGPKN